ncbi:ankyrin repeat domain-containing protein [Bordetella genomosp. 13]|uniref:ankyrin repeat domain-containing protein n=1 Tax=Bordetella genomosp. 13 TaxID=463040 RepID=UPI003B288844
MKSGQAKFATARIGAALRAGLLAAALLGGAQAMGAQVSTDWWPAIANDRTDDMRRMLAGGADPNLRYQNGQPALMRAVIDQAWGVFDLLAADPRTDVNAENPAGETPLMYLALMGQTERAKALIARGAQVNRLGWTPLHYAASKGQLETARLMLQHRAMPNAPSPLGTTPLMMAAYSGSQPMVQLLLDAGADPTTRDLKGHDAAEWADEGRAPTLADNLRQVIARAEQRKRELRAAQGQGEPIAPAPSLPAIAPTAPPASAPTPSQPGIGQGVDPAAAPGGSQAAPERDPATVRGVSGVRRETYD